MTDPMKRFPDLPPYNGPNAYKGPNETISHSSNKSNIVDYNLRRPPLPPHQEANTAHVDPMMRRPKLPPYTGPHAYKN